MRVLVVEDYQPLRENITECLLEQNFVVDTTATGDEGLWLATNQLYDVILLDIMLPNLDGLTLLKRLRASGSNVPAILISARDSVEQRIEGLETGADDYLVKPFALEEMLARVKAQIRRRYQKKSPLLNLDDLTIDTQKQLVARSGEEIPLTRKEYKILEYLAYRKGEVVTRPDIWEHVYDDQEGGLSNTLDVYIGYLRRKLNTGNRPNLIKTIRGRGYTLDPEIE